MLKEKRNRELLGNNYPTFRSIEDCTSMCHLLDYLMNPAEDFIVERCDFNSWGTYQGKMPHFANAFDDTSLWFLPLGLKDDTVSSFRYYSWNYKGVQELQQAPQGSEQETTLLAQISQQQAEHREILSLLHQKLNDPKWSIRLEEAIYEWIASANISDKEAEKILARFYELGTSESKIIELIEAIIKGNYKKLSIPELYRALRYAVYYNKTHLLHSLDFGIEETLKALQKHVEGIRCCRCNQKLKLVKVFLGEIVRCIEALKTPDDPKSAAAQRKHEVVDLRNRWKALKRTWKTNTVEELERLSEEMTAHQFQQIYISASDRVYLPISDTQRIMLAHALEIKSMLKDSHYTFIHGQSTEGWAYTAFYKELIKLEKSSQMFHYLRFNDESHSMEVQGADHWRKAEKVHDHNDFERAQLLSADGYFFHHNPAMERSAISHTCEFTVFPESCNLPALRNKK